MTSSAIILIEYGPGGLSDSTVPSVVEPDDLEVFLENGSLSVETAQVSASSNDQDERHAVTFDLVVDVDPICPCHRHLASPFEMISPCAMVVNPPPMH
jgi:hypothetical protein